MFCKGKCEEGNILVETTGDSEQRGRYSIRYVGSVLSVYLYVSITKLTKSDAGRYQCGLDRSVLFPGSHQDFEIRVKDAPTSSKPEVTPRPFPTSASTLTTTKGLFVSQQGQTASDGHGVVLYVRLTLVVMFIVLSASVLIFCWKRARKPRETADEAEYVNVTEANRECEEVREEDRGSRSPPIEMSVLSTSHCRHFSEDN
ncbi:CMRF35-like molecule 8 isoform X1 [Trematomus bernacchii]|uniref:CMRF35-like molecule 8 isoform X1 n=1 Tax=Trematomus bernacchii TaxID=40690 RepID=UPI001469C2AB|nr:CMRF35-like molecule 8 isoform X1 [Trematomus bernacchii]